MAYCEDNIATYLSREIGVDRRSINCVRVLKKSIDARQKQVYVNLTLCAFINEEPTDEAFIRTDYPDVSLARHAVVVGEGPCGLFAALRLIELGIKPIVIERGKDVRERKKDIARIKSSESVYPESNYCFGEGGAGAYSDGKLYTRSKKRGNINKILNVFCQFGASTSILADAHPHIGTDKLPRVIENMRNQIIASGGEVYFQTKMTRLLLKGKRVEGVEVVDQKNGAVREIDGPVILATGHSARDVYRYLANIPNEIGGLNNANLMIEPKGIAVGVRLEHPSHLIDQIQYHSPKGRGEYLPAAEYSFVTQVEGRGVYSFCMCPGGFVIPAATDKEQIVVNGMSPSNRGGKWSNSGMVVEVRPEDIQGYIPSEEGDKNDGVLSMMAFQEYMERLCWEQNANHNTMAPGQRMGDFVNGKPSHDLPQTSFAPGVFTSSLHSWMPKMVGKRLQEGFRYFGRQRRGFLTNDALMIGVETRTSSPVRITRNHDNLQHITLEGLFPAGEGAGYAGGIVSAGVDGERAAEMLAEYLQRL